MNAIKIVLLKTGNNTSIIMHHPYAIDKCTTTYMHIKPDESAFSPKTIEKDLTLHLSSSLLEMKIVAL